MAHGTSAYGPGQGVRHSPIRRHAVTVFFRTIASAAVAVVIAGSAAARHRRWLSPDALRVEGLAFFSAPSCPGKLLSPLRRPGAAAGLAARLSRCRRCASETPAGSADLDDLDNFDLDVVPDGVLQDDWNNYAEKAQEEAADKTLAEAASLDFGGKREAMEDWGITDPEEMALMEQLSQAWDEGRRHPEQSYEVLDRLKKFDSKDASKMDDSRMEERLERMYAAAGESSGDKWRPVQLNDTFYMDMAEVPGSMDKLLATMNSSKAEEEAYDDFLRGITISSAATVLARWMAIYPPKVSFVGKSVIDLGAGCGLLGLVAARLGAANVLLQDRDVVPLREAMESSMEAGVTAKVSTITVPWEDFPTKLFTGSEEVLLPFQNADIILASDVLLTEAACETLASVLSQLLRSPDQVAYVGEFYKGNHLKYFLKCCRSNGLNVIDREITTWEPPGDNPMENEPDWFIHLITIQRL